MRRDVKLTSAETLLRRIDNSNQLEADSPGPWLYKELNGTATTAEIAELENHGGFMRGGREYHLLAWQQTEESVIYGHRCRLSESPDLIIQDMTLDDPWTATLDAAFGPHDDWPDNYAQTRGWRIPENVRRSSDVTSLLRQELDRILADREKWSGKLHEEMNRIISALKPMLKSLSIPDVNADGWELVRWGDGELTLGRFRDEDGDDRDDPSAYIAAAGDIGYMALGPTIKASRNKRVAAARALPQLIQSLIERLKAENEEQEKAYEALRAIMPATTT